MEKSQNQKLRFRIIECSSEDPQYPVSTLLTSSANSRGWQSQRFCSTPQYLTFQFFSAVTLTQIQFLFHETKIPTKCDIMYALPELNSLLPLNELKWIKLGYFNLDSNEKNKFRVREFKTVFMDIACLYIRFVFDKCHYNQYNCFNQIGLVAFAPFGSLLTASPIKAVRTVKLSQVTKQGKNEYETQIDEVMTIKINELEEAKLIAVENENFDEASRIKQELLKLQQLGTQLQRLEEQKSIAIQNEDYTGANSSKRNIVRVREAIILIINAGRERRVFPNEFLEEEQFSHDDVDSEQEYFLQVNDDQLVLPSRHALQSQQKDGLQIESQSFEENKEFENQQNEAVLLSSRKNIDVTSRKDVGSISQNDMSYDETIIPTLAKKKGHGVPEESQQKVVQEAEGLTPLNAKFAEPLIPIIGEEICKHIFSKHWNLRELGLKIIIGEMSKGGKSKVVSSKDPWDLFVVLMGVVSFTIVDRVNQVSTKAIELLRLILSLSIRKIGVKNELISYVDIILNILLEKMADTNARIREQSELSILALMKNPMITCSFCLAIILKDQKSIKGKNAQSVKSTVGRLEILKKTVRQFKIDNQDVPYMPMVEYGISKLENSSAETRLAAISFLGEIYSLVGERLMKDLEGVRPAQMEVLKAEFARVGRTPLGKQGLFKSTANEKYEKNYPSEKKGKAATRYN